MNYYYHRLESLSLSAQMKADQFKAQISLKLVFQFKAGVKSHWIFFYYYFISYINKKRLSRPK